MEEEASERTRHPSREGDESGSHPRDVTGPRAGDVLDLRVEDLAYGGAGVGRVEGLVCFVEGAVPGDLVRVRIGSRKQAFARAQVLSLVEPSKQRVSPRCAHFGACGGCQWMNLGYETQLLHKERQVRDCLARIGALEGFRMHPISPSPGIFGYRNRMEFAFDQGPRGVLAGLHRADDPSVIEEIAECHLQDPLANRILRWTVEACREMGLGAARTRHPRTGHPRAQGRPRSLLQRLLVRRGSGDGRWLVALLTADGPFPEGPILAARMMEQFPGVAGVVRVIGRTEGSEGRLVTLAGNASVTESIDGLSLTVTAVAFLQVNSEQAARLYRCVLDLAAPASSDRALDLYSGAGAITLLLGRHVREATGIEASRESVRCAEQNARDNGVSRCRFIRRDARVACLDLVSQGKRYELIVANPPRAGLPKDVARAVAELGAERLVYVSCNPATLARDLARFAGLGYRTTDVAPFDMFPHTYHVETVARLERAR